MARTATLGNVRLIATSYMASLQTESGPSQIHPSALPMVPIATKRFRQRPVRLQPQKLPDATRPKRSHLSGFRPPLKADMPAHENQHTAGTDARNTSRPVGQQWFGCAPLEVGQILSAHANAQSDFGASWNPVRHCRDYRRRLRSIRANRMMVPMTRRANVV